MSTLRGAGRRGERGLTFIEMMIVLVIAGFMLGIAVPGFRDLLVRNRLTAQMNEFLVGMQTARSEAVKNMRTATMCKSDDGAACKTGGSADWSEGWLVWVDTDGDSTLDATEVVTAGNASDGITYAADADGGTTDLHDEDAISFRPDGSPIIGGSAGSGTLLVCIEQLVAGEVTLDLTGRASAKKLATAEDCP